MKKLVTTLAIALTAGAAPAANINQDTIEIGFSGLFDFNSVFDERIVAEVSGGYFLMDAVEVGAGVRFSDDDAQTLWALGLFGELQYDTGTEWIPYARGAVEFAGNNIEERGIDADGNAFVLSASAGLMYFLTEDLAIDARFTYRLASDDIYVESDALEDTEYLIQFGLRYFFDW